MEYWDAYDENFNKIEGVTLVRGKPIPEGVYHLVCDVLVMHSDGTYLLMKRDFRKPFGGTWEATAGGSALKNETLMECAKRELYEETGIIANSLKEIGREVSVNTIYVEYFFVTDIEKDDIRLQEGETIDHRWVLKEELLSMNKGELLTDRILRFY